MEAVLLSGRRPLSREPLLTGRGRRVAAFGLSTTCLPWSQAAYRATGHSGGKSIFKILVQQRAHVAALPSSFGNLPPTVVPDRRRHVCMAGQVLHGRYIGARVEQVRDNLYRIRRGHGGDNGDPCSYRRTGSRGAALDNRSRPSCGVSGLVPKEPLGNHSVGDGQVGFQGGLKLPDGLVCVRDGRTPRRLPVGG